jgi:hypothetical protein
MFVREAINDYKHWLSSTGDSSDDDDTSLQAIYNRLITSRATVLKQALAEGKKLSEEVYQTISCIELEEVDRVECPTIPASGCYWLKSTCPIPEQITLQSISTHLGAGYSYVRWDKIKERVGGRLKSAAREKLYSLRTIKDKVFLYIYNDEFIKNITITGIFQDPIKAAQYCEYDIDAMCIPMDVVSFHTPQHLMDTISKLTWDITMRARQAARLKILNNDSPIDQVSNTPKQG